MQHELERVKVREKVSNSNDNNWSKMTREPELANRLYVFCPDSPQGIEFCVQEINESVAKFSGSLPPGTFLSSKDTLVTWTHINGDKPLSEQKCGYHHTHTVNVRDGGSYKAATIIVSTSTFLDLLDQRSNPVEHQSTGYKIFSLSRGDELKKPNSRYNNKR